MKCLILTHFGLKVLIDWQSKKLQKIFSGKVSLRQFYLSWIITRSRTAACSHLDREVVKKRFGDLRVRKNMLKWVRRQKFSTRFYLVFVKEKSDSQNHHCRIKKDEIFDKNGWVYFFSLPRSLCGYDRINKGYLKQLFEGTFFGLWETSTTFEGT